MPQLTPKLKVPEPPLNNIHMYKVNTVIVSSKNNILDQKVETFSGRPFSVSIEFIRDLDL